MYGEQSVAMKRRGKLLAQLDEMILNIARLSPDPAEWQEWVLYLLEGLDWQAQSDENREAFTLALARVRDEIQARLEQENWWVRSIASSGEE